MLTPPSLAATAGSRCSRRHQTDPGCGGEEWTFEFDITAWGWIHIIVGIILILSGIGIFSGNVFARTVGVIVAGLAMIVNFAWLPYYPVWSIIIITICGAIIWALTAHGRDITYS